MTDEAVELSPRMSGSEALMWSLEADPALRSAFMTVTTLDGPVDFDRLKRRMGRAVKLIPRLRQRVVEPGGPLSVPEWVDDEDFDLDFHVRRVAAPAPGGERELLDLAAHVYEDGFDRARPLWQLTVIEGLAGDRSALLSKMHHTITDGVGGVRMSAMFIDVEREPDEPADEPEVAAEGPGDDSVEPSQSQFARTMANLQLPAELARRAFVGAVETLVHPAQMPKQAGEAAATARSMLRQLSVTEPARSPLWTRRSLRRRFEILSVDLERSKIAAKAMGGTLNDYFVCAVAGAAGAYHRAKGAPVDELRMSMPVNTRTDRSVGGNSFSPTRLLVPVDIEDPVARFVAVRERLSATKGEKGLAFTEALAGLLTYLPTPMVVRYAKQQVETVDFATSNVRGAPFELFIGGAMMLGNHPMGPTGGTAMNVTLMSYRGSLDMGIHVDPAAVEDSGLFRQLLEEAFEEQAVAGGAPLGSG